jgi:hypothetical protein
MEVDNKALLLWRQASMLEARVEIVHPPEAAALACPIEALDRLGTSLGALLPPFACGLQLQI